MVLFLPFLDVKDYSSTKLKDYFSSLLFLRMLFIFSIMLSELETHEDAWPFLLPVNSKLVPGYRKVIKKPMDFSTIREKFSSGL